MEPRARELLRREARRRRRPAARRRLRCAVRRGAAGRPRREASRRRRCSRCRLPDRSSSGTSGERRLLVNATAVPLAESGRAELGDGHDSAHREHHRPRPAGGAAADLGEDGVDRPAGRRRRARGQYAADRHLELHADAARRRRSAGSQDGAAREDRAPDLPRGEDRQRAPQSFAPGHAGRRTDHVDINAVIGDVFSLLEHQFEVGSIKVRTGTVGRLRDGARASSTSFSRSSSTSSSMRAMPCRAAAG